MKIITLLENDACRAELASARGLSLYVETGRHKVLFDMGPDEQFLRNAEKLGVDLSAVDMAVLSHGHSDHGGGLAAFCRVNAGAKIYLRREALGAYYAVLPGQEPHYIGLRPDEGLTLFSGVEDDRTVRAVAPKLQERTGAGFRPDGFAHEQHLLIEENGRAALLAGCGHLGMVNTLRAAKRYLGRMPDVVFGGFHLFEVTPDTPGAGELIAATARALAEGTTVYYTGHCTGDWAFAQLQKTLGDRLRPMNGGTAAEL